MNEHLNPEPLETASDDAVVFDGPVQAIGQAGGPSRLVRGGIVLGAAALFVVGAMAAMGASTTPPTNNAAGANPAASASPDASADPGKPGGPGHLGGGFGGPGFGGFGIGGGRGFGFGGITISAIDGSNLSVKTDDGWTRTIAVATDTTIDRAGAAIKVSDLKVGDQIGFREDRQTDGTYTISAINVILPSLAGQVTAVDGSTITVKRFDGTTGTIHVTSATTYEVAGVTTATLSDVKVDDVVIASGTARTDGSLDAEALHAGQFPGKGGFDGPWMGGHRGPDADPNASPAPSMTPG